MDDSVGFTILPSSYKHGVDDVSILCRTSKKPRKNRKNLEKNTYWGKTGE